MRMDKGAGWGIFWFLYHNAGSDLFFFTIWVFKFKGGGGRESRLGPLCEERGYLIERSIREFGERRED